MRVVLYGGAAALLVAVAPLEELAGQGFAETYYKTLRFFICAGCSFAAYVFLREKHAGPAIAFLAAGVLFNPIMKIQMDREIWIAADFLVATLFLVVARMLPRFEAARPTGQPIAVQAAEPQPAEVAP